LHRATELTTGAHPEPVGIPRKLSDRLSATRASLPLLHRVIAGSVLIAVLVAATFAVLLLSMSHLQDSTNAQARSKDVTAATLALERVVNQLETSLRAFVVSGNDSFLVSWRQGRSAFPTAISELRRLVADQPAQRSQVDELTTLIREYVGEYGVPLIAITRVDVRAARAPVATKEGLFRISTIRNRLSHLLASEDELASERTASAKRESTRAVRLGIAALGGAAALLLLFGIFLAKGIVRPVRTVAEGASRVAAGDLTTRLPESGAAEILDLTRAFNSMASSLDQGKRQLESQNEELRQSERLKSELVSIVSHELRTPLASIIGYASLLLKRDFGKAEVERYVEIIHSQGSRLVSLVEEFLDVERVEAGQIRLREELLDLKPMLFQEARMISDDAPKHEIRVSVAASRLPVRGDLDRLAQVYGNLLTNAVKYSPEGGAVEVAGMLEASAVRVEVHDDGIGIPDEHQQRIFTKFFRGEARESGIAGAGLGLAVSREIVEAHGGRIGFTSKAGVGSTFWFELPLAR
jgi:signal transduction histidine kinase